MRRLATAVVALATFAGCRTDTVQLGARPAVGDRAVYRIEVRAVSVTAFDERAPRRTVAESVFEARQEVLDVGVAGSRVRVRLRERGGPAATFVVRLDRAAQLFEVQTIEGLPAETLAGLGLSEIFPAAAAAPPQKPLAPGDRWVIDEPIRLGGSQPSRLVGRGRLARLGADHDHPLATVESAYQLPIERTQLDTGGRLSLEGTQRTRATVTYSLDDGVVDAARASTRGTFRIAAFPPLGIAGDPVPGTLTVEVRSVTRRLR